MPCYLFTFHAYGTWMPDREKGFVRRGKGILPPSREMAKQYRGRASEPTTSFDAKMQKLLIQETRIACEKQQYRGHCIATDATHVHALISWPDNRNWPKVRNGLKSSLTRRLNRNIGQRRHWFVAGASRKRVKDKTHFGHLINVYLPSHRGWKWREGEEMFL